MLQVIIISVLYIDYGTSSKVHFKDVRLIHKKFLSLPAQVIPVRLWAIFQVPFGCYTPMSSHKWEKLKEYRCYNCDYKATVRRGVMKHMDQCDEIEN